VSAINRGVAISREKTIRLLQEYLWQAHLGRGKYRRTSTSSTSGSLRVVNKKAAAVAGALSDRREGR